jgi:hypothetical protein
MIHLRIDCRRVEPPMAEDLGDVSEVCTSVEHPVAAVCRSR